jgi:ABC-type Fe3+/spermidine/putrescine transport system ATPase subunit
MNRFVGEFIGDSNFFVGRIERAQPGWAELAGIGPVRIAMDGSAPSGEIDLMIRPERLRPCAGGEGGNNNVFKMTIEDVINHGDSMLVIGNTHGLSVRARLVGGKPDSLQPGATLPLAWSPADAHVLVRR